MFLVTAVVTTCFSYLLSLDSEESGRRGDLMVSALDSRSNGLGSSPGWGTALLSLAGHFALKVLLITQVYKWILANLLLGVTLRWMCIPSRGE